MGNLVFRNKLVWDHKVVTSMVAMECNSKIMVDWQQSKSKPINSGIKKSITTRKDEHIKQWKPPAQGSLKNNVDVSVY